MDVKITLSSTEHKELISFCNLNDLLVSETVKKSYMNGFNIERFGLLNSGQETIEKEVIKEVIKYVEVPVVEEKEVIKIEYIEVEKPIEVIKEVPVEKIVEVTKEVPVEKIVEVIKEVPVERIVEVIKEVPVERVVEKIVEITKEVPVEKVVIKEVIKEVPVEKVVYITDQEEMKSKIFQKEQEFEEQRKIFSTKTQEMENIFQNEKNELLSKIQQLENTPPQIVDVIREVNVEVPIEVVREVVVEVPVEVIKEVNVEVPVEVIREVIREVRVEVPVEVIVEKENNDSSLKPKFDALQNTVQKLRQEILDKDKLIKEYQGTIEDIQRYQGETKAVYLKGSNLDNKLYK
jgi:hypothetical protein